MYNSIGMEYLIAIMIYDKRTIMHNPTFIGTQKQYQHRHFSSPVVSCDGVLGKEATIVLQSLAESLAKKS